MATKDGRCPKVHGGSVGAWWSGAYPFSPHQAPSRLSAPTSASTQARSSAEVRGVRANSRSPGRSRAASAGVRPVPANRAPSLDPYSVGCIAARNGA